MFCEKCGQQIADDASFCPYCNNVINRPNQQNNYYQPQPEQQNTYYNPQQTYQAPEQNGAYPPPQQDNYFTQQSNPYGNSFYPPADQSIINTISNCKTLGIIAIIVGIFVPIAGIICGAIGLSNVKNIPDHPKYINDKASVRRLNILGIVIPIIIWAVIFLLYILIMIFAVGAIGGLSSLY